MTELLAEDTNLAGHDVWLWSGNGAVYNRKRR